MLPAMSLQDVSNAAVYTLMLNRQMRELLRGDQMDTGEISAGAQLNTQHKQVLAQPRQLVLYKIGAGFITCTNHDIVVYCRPIKRSWLPPDPVHC